MAGFSWKNPLNSTFASGEVTVFTKGPLFLKWGKILIKRGES
jgi:hypothetical protein